MIKFFKYLLFTLILLLVISLVFFFWAKSPNLEANEYNQEIQYSVQLPKKNDSILTVMTYNIGYLSGMTNNRPVRPSREFYQKNEEELLRLLGETHPDLIGFQEIDYGSKRSYEVNQHAHIGSKLYPYTVQAINWDKRYVPFPYYPLEVHFGKLLSGQSIMSKYALNASKRIVLEKVASLPFYYKAIYLDRLLQTVKVKHPLGDITFMNVHAEAFNQETRSHQIAFLHEKFWEAAKDGPVILVGDFNSDPSYTNSAISQFLNDKKIGSAAMNTKKGSKLAKSFPSKSPKGRLDYIFFTKDDFELINSKILNSYGEISDHLPCFAELKLKKK